MTAYLALASAFVRSRLAYRASFAARLVAIALADLAPLALLAIVLTRFPSIAGWRWPELALLFGLIQTAASIERCFAVPFRHFEELVLGGGFDILLCRPLSPLLSVVAGGFELVQVGRIAGGVAVLVYAFPAAGIAATPANLALAAATVAGGALLLFSFTLAIATLAFWAGATGKLHDIVQGSARAFAEYPLVIYPGAIRALLTWVLPLALVTYYPARRLLGRAEGPLAHAALPMGALFLCGALLFWRLGVRRYHSTGS